MESACDGRLFFHTFYFVAAPNIYLWSLLFCQIWYLRLYLCPQLLREKESFSALKPWLLCSRTQLLLLYAACWFSWILDSPYLGTNLVKCLANCYMLDQSHWFGILLCFWCIQWWSIFFFLSFNLWPICFLSVHRLDKIEGSGFSSISGKHCTCCNFIVLITFMPFFHSHASIFCNVKSIDCDRYLVWGILFWSEEV